MAARRRSPSIPGVVFFGASAGLFCAYSTADGKALWQFDTAREFDTVNGVAGDWREHQRAPAPSSLAAWCSSPSGYSELGNGARGNVLLAFGVPKQ